MDSAHQSYICSERLGYRHSVSDVYYSYLLFHKQMVEVRLSMNVMTMLSRALDRKDEELSSSVIDDVLCIDCRRCTSRPDIKSQGCVRCVVGQITVQGNIERIRLRTSRDLEISGKTVESLCELAFLDRSIRNMSTSASTRSCNGCDYSLMKVFDIAWKGFPDPYFEAAREHLMKFRAEDDACAACLQRTYRALDQAERGLSGIIRGLSSKVGTGGV